MTDEHGLRSLPSDEFRDVIGHFASGVTVITALHEDRPYGTTASAVTSLSVEPPMVLICMNKTSQTGRAISATGRFAINILGEDQPDAAVRFAGKGADKFTGTATTPGAWGEPLIDEALATLECRVVEETTGGTHWVFLAEVDHASARAGTPLAYFRGQFGRLELAQDEQALGDLRALLLRREIAVGEPLEIDALSLRLSVPRGPVYHALSKLTTQGLVVRTGDGAFAVAEVTFEALRDALAARAAIELGVAAQRVGHLSADELAECRRLADALAQDDGDGRAAALTAFADHMVSLAGSDTLLDAYRHVNVPVIVASVRSTGPPAEVQVADGAEELVDAYEAGDLAAAVAVIQRQTQGAIEVVRKTLRQRGSSRSTFQ